MLYNVRLTYDYPFSQTPFLELYIFMLTNARKEKQKVRTSLAAADVIVVTLKQNTCS